MSVTAVAGTRRSMKELVDGTIRVQIDIDKKFRRDFLEMFGEIDMPIALAPLVPTFEREQAGEQSMPAGSTNAGWKNLGPLAQSAVLRAKEELFQQYVAEMTNKECADEVDAANYIKDYCQVQSRKELDTADGAKSRFGALMAHFREWQR